MLKVLFCATTFGGGRALIYALLVPQSSWVFFFGIRAKGVWWQRFELRCFLCFSVVPRVTNKRQCSDHSCWSRKWQELMWRNLLKSYSELTFKLSLVLSWSMPKFCIIFKIWSFGSYDAVPTIPLHIVVITGISITSTSIQRCRLICSIVTRLFGCKTSIFLINDSQSIKKLKKSFRRCCAELSVIKLTWAHEKWDSKTSGKNSIS